MYRQTRYATWGYERHAYARSAYVRHAVRSARFTPMVAMHRNGGGVGMGTYQGLIIFGVTAEIKVVLSVRDIVRDGRDRS